MKKKIIISTLVIFLLIAIAVAIYGYSYYQMIYQPNVNLNDKKTTFLYIKTGANYREVFDSLVKNNILIDTVSFQWVVAKKKYETKVKAGKYLIKNNMSNNDLVNMLRAGDQVPVKVTFNNVRTIQQLAGKVAKSLEPDSMNFSMLFNDNALLDKFGFNNTTLIAMFIPNTYEMYWNTSAEKFLEKMFDEYTDFWNKEREEKLKNLGMTKVQVVTLASIVQAEQAVYNDEKPIIAGLYINRLRKGMLLESCPTLVYAIGDFTIKRILDKDKEVESPYNTYKNIGLPPSPINLPEISSIDAVLNYQTTDYLFLCAKDDFSGYHYFSKTASQHGAYAKLYHEALNKRGIKR